MTAQEATAIADDLEAAQRSQRNGMVALILVAATIILRAVAKARRVP